jgi:predicted nucleotide-binding protein (sugar kinase/HSP70/actin superfamily)
MDRGVDVRVALPHLGTAYVAYRAFFGDLGVDIVVPPTCNQRTLDLGTQYSPEFVCTPFKLILGNFIEAIEHGADMLLTAESTGCRLGYYARLQKRILEDLGYRARVEVILPLADPLRGFLKNLRYITHGASLRRILAAMRFALAKLGAADELERLVERVRAREVMQGNADALWHRAIDAIDEAGDLDAVERVRSEWMEALQEVPTVPGRRPLRVGIVGEFYVLLETFINMNIEVELGRRGVEVERAVYVSRWTQTDWILKALAFNANVELERAAAPYLKRNVSGDGQRTIGESVLYAQKGYDGLIHLTPFPCIPEIVAQNIFPAMTEDIQTPLLSIVLDENTGRTGVLTRLEAFIDLLQRRRARGVKVS